MKPSDYEAAVLVHVFVLPFVAVPADAPDISPVEYVFYLAVGYQVPFLVVGAVYEPEIEAVVVLVTGGVGIVPDLEILAW